MNVRQVDRAARGPDGWLGRRGWALAALTGIVGMLLSGCDAFLNQTAERNGSITVAFVNNTPYRAAFSYGTYDPLDLSPQPGPTELQQLRLEAGTSSASVTVACRRTLAIGTQAYVDRAVANDADLAASFDADAFDAVVHFSSAPQDSDAAALPTAGTAAGVEKLVGVDFSCGDQLLFTFVQDPHAPGGFRTDFSVVVNRSGTSP